MKIEQRIRQIGEGRYFTELVLVTENERESTLLDKTFGSKVDDDGKIADVCGTLRLSTNFEHYLVLRGWENE